MKGWLRGSRGAGPDNGGGSMSADADCLVLDPNDAAVS